MNKFTLNSVIKKILIVFISLVIISSFIAPNQVHAASFWTKVGKDLINGFFQLLVFISDLFLQIMQNMMVGIWEIEDYGGNSAIQYSPRNNFFR